MFGTYTCLWLSTFLCFVANMYAILRANIKKILDRKRGRKKQKKRGERDKEREEKERRERGKRDRERGGKGETRIPQRLYGQDNCLPFLLSYLLTFPPPHILRTSFVLPPHASFPTSQSSKFQSISI